MFSYHRMCSLTEDRGKDGDKSVWSAVLVQNVFSYHRMCSLTEDTGKDRDKSVWSAASQNLQHQRLNQVPRPLDSTKS